MKRSRRSAAVLVVVLAVVALAACDLTDSDGDGISDILETQHGWDPADPDEDGDGQLDGVQDSDGDGLTDWLEENLDSNPHDRNSPDDGSDADQDWLTDWTEDLLGTNSSTADTDGDGWWDKEEAFAGTGALDGASHPWQRGDPPCDDAVDGCPDVELFSFSAANRHAFAMCPVPVCEPSFSVTSDRGEGHAWYVRAEVGPFHENPDGTGYWPLESATITGRGVGWDDAAFSDACRSSYVDTSWSQARPVAIAPGTPIVTRSAGGLVQVAPGVDWGTEVLRRVDTTFPCGTGTTSSSWVPWPGLSGLCGSGGSGFLDAEGTAVTSCTEERFQSSVPAGQWTQIETGHARGTFRLPT